MTQHLRRNISSNLVKLRNLNRYSQDKIAAVLSIRQPSYCVMESSATDIRAYQLYILADFYKVGIESFFYEDSDFKSMVGSQERINKLESDLANSNIINNVLIARNVELEDKVKRKDAKIESLLDELSRSGIKQRFQSKEFSQFSTTLKSSALPTVLSVSIIIFSVVLSVLFLSQRLSASSQHILRKRRLENNSISGINVLLGSKNDGNQEMETLDLFGTGSDSVGLKKFIWGVYDIGLSKAFFRNDTITNMCMIGNGLNKADRLALYLEDADLPLSISGDTRIIGDVKIPEAGIRRSYIEGVNYSGDKDVDGDIKFSSKSLTAINESYLHPVWKYLSMDTPEALATENVRYAIPDHLSAPFDKPTEYVYISDSLVIADVSLKGNIAIISSMPIVIFNNAILEDIAIFAPSIYIDDGFHGSLQLFANHKIIISKDVKLDYPSALGLCLNDSGINVGDDGNILRMDSASTCNGIVFSQIAAGFKDSPIIEIDKDAEVYGQVYSAGLLELQGKVIGTTITKGFVLKTTSSLYDNFLLNGVLNSKSLSPYYIGSPLLNTSGNSDVIKWL